MTKEQSQKELWRNRWLRCINELTSYNLQLKSWLDSSNANPHWSFIEFMCSYFDDLVIDNDYEYQLKENWISEPEFEIIREWHNLLDKYDSPNNDDHNREGILNDEKWKMIVKLGQEAKIELSRILKNEEKQIR